MRKSSLPITAIQVVACLALVTTLSSFAASFLGASLRGHGAKERNYVHNGGNRRKLVANATVSEGIERSAQGINTFLNFFEPNDASFGLNNIEEGILLANGLTVRMLAVAGHKVHYVDGTQSSIPFHARADGGHVFEDTRPENPGGWIYVSNSEMGNPGEGGVGALTFNSHGEVVDYKMVLENTVMNCNGGATHFGAWISCEEDFASLDGKAWQVDPTGQRQPRPITLGSDGGAWESFTADLRNPSRPYFYLTEDLSNGAIQRFTPDNPNADPWEMLLGSGTIDYLFLSPNLLDSNRGSFRFTTNKDSARQNARSFYPNTEGMDINGNFMYFVSKVDKTMFTLNLNGGTYKRSSTQTGLFDGQPDQLRTVLGTEPGGATRSSIMLYYTEDGGSRAGIHARDEFENIFTILESGLYQPETTGVSFTPDGKRLYFAYQNDGILFELRRKDGESFRARSLNLKTHPTEMTDEERKRRHRKL